MRETLDAAVVQELRTVLGAEFGLLVSTFIADSGQRVRELRAALAAGDAGALRAAAHTLKGSSLNVGALALADLCLDLEQQARRGELGGVALGIDAVEAALATVGERLQAA